MANPIAERMLCLKEAMHSSYITNKIIPYLPVMEGNLSIKNYKHRKCAPSPYTILSGLLDYSFIMKASSSATVAMILSQVKLLDLVKPANCRRYAAAAAD